LKQVDVYTYGAVSFEMFKNLSVLFNEDGHINDRRRAAIVKFSALTEKATSWYNYVDGKLHSTTGPAVREGVVVPDRPSCQRLFWYRDGRPSTGPEGRRAISISKDNVLDAGNWVKPYFEVNLSEWFEYYVRLHVLRPFPIGARRRDSRLIANDKCDTLIKCYLNGLTGEGDCDCSAKYEGDLEAMAREHEFTVVTSTGPADANYPSHFHIEQVLTFGNDGRTVSAVGPLLRFYQ
jgi:hypothetical protein